MHREQHDGVVTLTFDKPDRLNAVSAADMDAVAEAVEAAGADRSVRVIVLAGEGRAFCSGADIGGGSDVSDAAGETIDAANQLVSAMIASPKPVVVRARGVVAGVGVSIALAGDLVLSDEDSYLLLAFTRIGLMPDGGATALVAASIGRGRALRMALLAEKLPAAQAQDAGLISHVWPAADYDREADALIASLSQGPAVAYARTKQAINTATLPHLAGSLALEREGQIGLLGADDFAEGSAAFRDKRAAQFSDTI